MPLIFLEAEEPNEGTHWPLVNQHKSVHMLIPEGNPCVMGTRESVDNCSISQSFHN